MRLESLPDNMKDNFDSDSLVYRDDDTLLYGVDISKRLIEDIQNRELQVFSGYYIFNKGYKCPKIFLSGRGIKSGKVKFKVEGFYPYCYIKDKKGKYTSYLGDKVDKVVFKGLHPSSVKIFRKAKRKGGYPMPYESDILFVRRFMIDMYDFFKPKKPITPKVVILDIETNHPIDDSIISYAMNDMNGELIYSSKYDTEYEVDLALEIYDKLQEYDIVTGWYVDFDIGCLHKKKGQMGTLDKIDKHLNYAKLNRGFTKEEYIKNMLKGKVVYFSEEETRHLIEVLLDRDMLREVDGVIMLGDTPFDPNTHHHLVAVDLKTISKKMHGKEIKGKWTLDNVGVRIAGIGKTPWNNI